MILITGGAGYIGRHVVLELQSSGPIVIVDNLSTGDATLLPKHIPMIHVDLRDTAKLQEVFKTYRPESVIHLAASLSVADSLSHPLFYYDNNVRSTISLLLCCQQWKTKNLLFASTAAVYGNVQKKKLKESDPCTPINPYGESKLMCERIIIDSAAAIGLRYGILRFFNVAGADPQLRVGPIGDQEHLIGVCLAVASGQKKKVPVYGDDYPTADGTAIRDFIHVSDIAKAHMNALVYLDNQETSQIFNVGYGRGYSVKEIISCVESVTGRLIPMARSPRRSGDSIESVANNAKLLRLTGWKPTYNSLQTMIQTAWAWKNRHNLHDDQTISK